MSTSIVAASQEQLGNVDEESRRKMREVVQNLKEITGTRKEEIISRAARGKELRKLKNAVSKENNTVNRDNTVVYDSKELATYFIITNYDVRNENQEGKRGEILIPLRM